MDRKAWTALKLATIALAAAAFAACALHVWFPIKSCEELNQLYAPLMWNDCSKMR